jgi:hypothetical protein
MTAAIHAVRLFIYFQGVFLPLGQDVARLWGTSNLYPVAVKGTLLQNGGWSVKRLPIYT